MKILKFGGSSISTPARVKKVVGIVLNSKDARAVVFSAFSGVTDGLIEIGSLAASGQVEYKRLLEEMEQRHTAAAESLLPDASQTIALAYVKARFKELKSLLRGVYLIKGISLRAQDLIISFGERLSAFIICEAVNQKIKAEFLDTRALVKTDENFGKAKVDYDLTYRNVADYFKTHDQLQIATGFISSSRNGLTTTLGRNGSDFTASLFAHALDADELEIWTDVDGILTANPKKVPGAFPIKNLTYDEAMELSHFGAGVIHSPTIQPALTKNIPIRIKNTFNPGFEGTLISDKAKSGGCLVTGTSSISNTALLRVQGSGMVRVVTIAKRLFGVLADNNINVMLITQASSERNICLSVKPAKADRARDVIEEQFALEIQADHMDKVVVEKDLAIIAIVGANMSKKPGVAGRFFQALGKENINVIAIAQGSSELNISVVINKKDEAKALNAVHATFFMDRKRQ